jgi:hypothetical protein
VPDVVDVQHCRLVHEYQTRREAMAELARLDAIPCDTA